MLPDNAVRIAVRKLSGTGSMSFGPAQLGYQGNSYQVVLDYINADVANIRFARAGLTHEKGIQTTAFVRLDEAAAPAASEVVIPVYVGIGLRLVAHVTVHKGKVNLSSLGSLSAAV